jgi:hypothetical protein
MAGAGKGRERRRVGGGGLVVVGWGQPEPGPGGVAGLPPSLQRQPNRLLFYPRLPLPISTCTLHDRRGPHLGTRGPVSGAAWPSDAGRDAVPGGHATPLWLSLPLPFFEKEKKIAVRRAARTDGSVESKGAQKLAGFSTKACCLYYSNKTSRIQIWFSVRRLRPGLRCVRRREGRRPYDVV